LVHYFAWFGASKKFLIPVMKSCYFLNGIKKDIDALENACTLPYDSGLAESSGK